MKNVHILIIIISLALIIAVSIAIASCEITKKEVSSSLVVDFSESEGEITYGAIGFLYGLAEPDVPNANLLNGIKPQVLATRVPNGLQHPSGDIAKVQSTFFENGGQNAIIYMQDIYPDWYYAYRSDHLATMEKVIDSLIVLEYSDKFIYQPFNEMNNGVWYGDFNVKENRIKFYDAYKQMYQLIKEKTNGAPVGGPAYTDYNSKLIREFLVYCLENDCVPDVMIWHELMWYSTYGLKDNVSDYRAIEKELDIEPRRIIIDEYGTFKDIGNPGNLIQYISSFETTKTEACLAFWRIPNNLNDLASDNNTPTSSWWLFNWYSNMQGETFSTKKTTDTFHNFSGISSLDEEKATILCGGTNGNGTITLKNLKSTSLFKNAKSLSYSIEYLDFNGLSAPSSGGIQLEQGTLCLDSQGTATIKIDNLSFSRAYRINLYPSYDLILAPNKTSFDTPIRYEAEKSTTNATILKKDNVRYASSEGAVRLDKNGHYLTFNCNVNESGYYKINIAYMSAPRISDAIVNARLKIKINNNVSVEYLNNTLTDQASSSFTTYAYLNSDNNTIILEEEFGDVTVDFIDILKVSNTIEDYEYRINGRLNYNDDYIIVTEKSGYYNILTIAEVLTVNGLNVTSNFVYLQNGLNYLTLSQKDQSLEAVYLSNDGSLTYNVSDASGAETYLIQNEHAPSGEYVKNVPANHELSFNVDIEHEGFYALTTVYSYHEIFGTHSYNEKLVERYATVKINGSKEKTVYFANTYSNYNFKENNIFIYLREGINNISFINEADYIWNNLTPKLPNIALIKLSPINI